MGRGNMKAKLGQFIHAFDPFTWYYLWDVNRTNPIIGLSIGSDVLMAYQIIISGGGLKSDHSVWE